MARYDLDYDFDYGYEYRRPMPRTSWHPTRYGADRKWRGSRRGWGWAGYAAEYPPGYGRYNLGYAAEYGPIGYDREFGKSRWETDYGDPFRDRERHTPIRMMRGEWGGYDRDYRRRTGGRGMDWRDAYGYEYRFQPRRRRY